jgi:hypothetical protein
LFYFQDFSFQDFRFKDSGERHRAESSSTGFKIAILHFSIFHFSHFYMFSYSSSGHFKFNFNLLHQTWLYFQLFPPFQNTVSAQFPQISISFCTYFESSFSLPITRRVRPRPRAAARVNPRRRPAVPIVLPPFPPLRRPVPVQPTPPRPRP